MYSKLLIVSNSHATYALNESSIPNAVTTSIVQPAIPTTAINVLAFERATSLIFHFVDSDNFLKAFLVVKLFSLTFTLGCSILNAVAAGSFKIFLQDK